MTIALDASSTCFHLARQLPDIRPHRIYQQSAYLPRDGKRGGSRLSAPAERLSVKYRCYVNPALVTRG